MSLEKLCSLAMAVESDSEDTRIRGLTTSTPLSEVPPFKTIHKHDAGHTNIFRPTYEHLDLASLALETNPQNHFRRLAAGICVEYAVEMFDSEGDGWNGAVLFVANLTFSLESGSAGTSTACLVPGAAFTPYACGGSYPEEVTWSVGGRERKRFIVVRKRNWQRVLCRNTCTDSGPNFDAGAERFASTHAGSLFAPGGENGCPSADINRRRGPAGSSCQ